MLPAKVLRDGGVDVEEKRYSVEVVEWLGRTLKLFGNEILDKRVDRENTGRNEAPVEAFRERFANKMRRALSGKNDDRIAEVVCTMFQSRDDLVNQILRG
jgi:hypothetical protein